MKDIEVFLSASGIKSYLPIGDLTHLVSLKKANFVPRVGEQWIHINVPYVILEVFRDFDHDRFVITVWSRAAHPGVANLLALNNAL